MVGGPSPGCGDAWCCGCKHGDAACFWIASVRWQDGDCFCALAEPCEPSTVFLKCLPSFCFVAIIVSHSFVSRSAPTFCCFTMAEAPLDASDSEAADAAAETTTDDCPTSPVPEPDAGDPRSSSDWQTASLDGKDPRWQRSAIIQRLADAIAYRSGSSSTRRAPPQAYVLLRAILDRRWKQINNISNTIHNDTKQYNTIYHIIPRPL